MSVNYDVVIKSGNDAVEMNAALETLSGARDVACLLAEAILRKKVVYKITASSPATAVLHQSFKSSYGQNFELVINDKKLNARLTEMTNSVFVEVMSFYISEALYIQNPPLSSKAVEYIKELEDIEDDIVGRIRNPLKQMHKINYRNRYDIEFNYKGAERKRKIVTLNTNTGDNLVYTETKRESIEIIAVVTRFNSRTGNGRIVLQGENDTVAFGFYMPFGAVPGNQKKLMSHNLYTNTGRREDYVFLRMIVSRVVIKNGDTVKYLVHSASVLD
ncbi:hypothetical protein OGV29_19205 [Citrobacter sp. Cb013]|uniref:hypothetical protein n=1 Tax=Citrobacter sp. Cb013 TaxID=2985013 RepID=UPI00257EB9C9|nr:hypothetical protein [Citrobacter sp. Cb013]MDM3390903.1 hypothetical protein [Citrobacter sp. Cb013]